MGTVSRSTKGWVAPGLGKLGGGTGFENILEFVIQFGNGMNMISEVLAIRDIEVDDLNNNSVIGAPTIQFHNLTKLLHTHLQQISPLCEICAHETQYRHTDTQERN
jgi:hypothetical protein